MPCSSWRVASAEVAFDELDERFAALDVGEEPEPLYEVLLQREADLTRLLRPGTIELLRTPTRERPESTRETARLLDRDIHQVHDTVTELAHLNLLRLETEGRRKRPVVWYDALEIELLTGTDAGPAVSAYQRPRGDPSAPSRDAPAHSRPRYEESR